MTGLVFFSVSLADDFLQWWSIYRLRREALEAADRLILIFEKNGYDLSSSSLSSSKEERIGGGGGKKGGKRSESRRSRRVGRRSDIDDPPPHPGDAMMGGKKPPRRVSNQKKGERKATPLFLVTSRILL
jgi:hypothetical protein